MSIPKTIYQTFKTSRLPWLTQYHIYNMRKRNPSYDYRFYDDMMIEEFLKSEFEPEVFDIYKSINVGAAKGDFFRYNILYKKGGVYLDIDSLFLTKIDDIIRPDDSAVISLESNLDYYVQYALFYEPGHPFLKRTIELMLENLRTNKFPYNTHQMTGPTVYTEAIRSCLTDTPKVPHRQIDINYEKKVKFSYPMSKTFLYGFSRKNHWKTLSKTQPILKEK